MITCDLKQTVPHDSDQVQLSFAADYKDGRNAEWAKYTPGLSLTMTVKGSVSDQFEAGKSYVLTFEEETDGSAGS